ncbi:MAG: methionine--tRNA ligase [Patescibacteria group bacterium]|nr:methionine--tRNA ligase [Patescibacteria group bacterium]
MVNKTKKSGKKYFVGVAWPYVNGELHIGHFAGYLLPADIFARYLRAIGKDVLMVSGSDCYGTPITIEADKKGVAPKEIADAYHERNVRLFREILGLTYDLYTRTDTKHHQLVVQEFFLGLLKNGYIYVDIMKQYYSTQEAKFLPDRYVEGKCKYCGYENARSDQCDNCGKVLDEGDLENPRSKLTGGTVELKDTQHYFLDWPKLQADIFSYVNKSGPNWRKWIYNETLAWLDKGLKPRAITRDIDWGVPLPVDRIPKDQIIENISQKRFYVWFDAVIGYLSASKLWAQETGGNWEEYWINPNAKHYYFMGKDNLLFHTVFWPGQLIGYDKKLHLPDQPIINHFLDYDGQQFSKSRGVSITIEEMVCKFGSDSVRFYLTLIMPENNDSSFRWQDFQSKVNDVLVATFGNFAHRSLSLAHKSDVSKVASNYLVEEVKSKIQKAFDKARRSLDNCEFRNYLNSTILELSSFGNKYINIEEIWELKKNDYQRFNMTLKQLYSLIVSLAYLSIPLLPETSEKLFKFLGLRPETTWPEPGKEIEEIESLVGKIDSTIPPALLFKKVEILTNQ